MRNPTIAPQSRVLDHRSILSAVEHEIARIQVDDILPVGERRPVNFPKTHSIKKHVKDFPPLEWEDRRTILEFINDLSNTSENI